jgi:phage terminase large subunit-like protein
MTWTTACPDWRERIVARQSLVPCPPIYPGKAAEALAIFSSLQMTDLAQREDGKWPTMGEVCEQFVFDLVGAIFGSEDPETGVRHVKEAMLLISKKNGKSTIAAGIMLTALILNWRHYAELLILSPTMEVANNSFKAAQGMVRADPELDALLHVVEVQRLIKHRVNHAELKILAADSGVVGGKKAAFVLADELWLFGKQQKSEAMLEEATGGQAARPEGFTIYLTTHSDEPPAGVFRSKLLYAREVRDGVIEDPAFLPMLYEWPEDMLESEAYLDPAHYYVTNPNIGKSPTVEFIARKIAQAQAGEGQDGDTSLQIVLAKYLNVEIGMRLHRDRWGGADYWMQAAEEDGLTLAELLKRSEVVTVGIDGGGLDDWFGLAVVGREKGTRRWLVWTRAWCLKISLERRKAIASVASVFIADGDLVVAPNMHSMFDDIVSHLVVIRDSGLLPAENAIGVDPADIGALVDALRAEGFRTHDVDPRTNAVVKLNQIEPVRQGVQLTGPIHTAEFMLHDGELVHGGSAMMAWCVSNAKAVQKGNSVAIDKQISGAAKIDPVIALFCAIKLMEYGPQAGVVQSPYAEHGLIVI